MISNESVWVRVGDGFALLAPDAGGRLTLSGPRDSRVTVHPQPAVSFSACAAEGSLYVLVLTQGGSLHCAITQDASQWRKLTLTGSSQDVRIGDHCIQVADDMMHVVYIARRQQSEAVVYYRQDGRGGWTGKTLDTYGAEAGLRLLQTISFHDDIYAYVQSAMQGKAQVRRYSLILEPGNYTELLLAPLPLTDFQVCRHADSLHMCWLSDGRVYADGTPLCWSNRCRFPCLSSAHGELACTWLEPDGTRRMALSASGWQPAKAPRLEGEPSLHIIHEKGCADRSLEAPVHSAVPPRGNLPADSDDALAASRPYQAQPAAQTAALFRQLSERIDRMQADIDAVRNAVSRLSRKKKPAGASSDAQPDVSLPKPAERTGE